MGGSLVELPASLAQEYGLVVYQPMHRFIKHPDIRPISISILTIILLGQLIGPTIDWLWSLVIANKLPFSIFRMLDINGSLNGPTSPLSLLTYLISGITISFTTKNNSAITGLKTGLLISLIEAILQVAAIVYWLPLEKTFHLWSYLDQLEHHLVATIYLCLFLCLGGWLGQTLRSFFFSLRTIGQ